MLRGGYVVISFNTEAEQSSWIHWVTGTVVIGGGYVATLLLILWLRT